MSVMIPEVTVGSGEIESPRVAEIAKYAEYRWGKDRRIGNSVLMKVATRLTISGLTPGISVNHPNITLPIVFVIPIMEMRKEDCSGDSPLLSPI